MLLGWLLLSGYLLWQDQRSVVGVFDPEQRWQQQGTHELELSSLLAAPSGSSMQLLHVIDPACRCHRQQQQHQQTLQQSFAGIPQQTLSIAEARQLGLSIPAAPMAILLNGNELVYAGPYTAGPICGSGDGWIERLLRDEIQFAGTWLNGESSSCRCLQSV
ncbi:DUF6436 domain-containing protein [Alkalimonas delamerensis]|uniref:DUF6436 domain-containing protein n=1 Tax=Alkalimonas delamerensis TaxID=265981 RepID=A0ABT9GQH5_9GAMM|nr:DUF6436 domain-containing protein [Alkalimonas delamerensis]MDP4529228.1 DUF6436 domain-containing protein [Alkalimonas delamerensis]